ncbi:polysaccharide deacetylase [Paenibacillus baekrokdamisoli]|uniref:Polysaccharide deacetylase n=1 Tax=Paenibacillus baekrokdamisoli TaxID=1712516 RepID=A0A3G9IXA0_9BACL|nr:polysaccharide deacetylase family protein [Paenibacillus baekrokdamisoli]MBB3068716.1 peptidoglycan/xylan/chitin deacetylase (PgdA/CDA1 family) [Paenibacillus baekrokdamisoli]BBH23547.1 polysaccharide deacetylase [Paenibacillus baekrokdamisoli]
MNDKIHVIFGFDMETDVGSFTPYYDGVKNATAPLVEMFDNKGIKGTFFYTGDAARRNPESVELVKLSGNEVGTHSLFHETVGDQLFPIPGVVPLLPEEVPFRIRKATEWVEEVLGEQPVSFRCPRLWSSTAVVNALEELNYVVDASYPMYFYRERLVPYHPSEQDWTKEGNLNILQIPNFADMVMKSKDPGLERDRDQWPLFRTKGANALMKRVDSFIKFMRQKELPVVLCFYFHPWEFIPLEKSYHFGECRVTPDRFLTLNCGDKAMSEFGILIDRLKDLGAEFHRADEFASLWNKAHDVQIASV